MFEFSDRWYVAPAMFDASLPPPPLRPTYTAAEAARYARTSPTTARRWLEGYKYQTKRGERRSGPVTSHPAAQRWLTFYDLVEVAAIASAISHGVSLVRIRSAIDYARDLFNYDRPL